MGVMWSRFSSDLTTLLHTAARKNDGDMVRFLQKVPGANDSDKGWVDLDQTDVDGYTATQFAVLHREKLHALEALDPLASQVASIENSHTPYSIAFKYGFFHACSRLDRFLGADSRQPFFGGEFEDNDEGTNRALHHAVRPIEKFFIPSSSQEREVWERERAAFVETLLTIPGIGCFVNGTDAYGRNPLDASIALGTASPRLIRCLLENGADANHKDNHGQTALQRICRYDDLKLLKACAGPLLRHGARLDVVGAFALTAFEEALTRARDGPNRDYANVEFLLQHATPANLEDYYLHKMLFIAHGTGFYTECRVLMRHGAVLKLSADQTRSFLEGSVLHTRFSQMTFYLDKFPDQVNARDALEMALELYFVPPREGKVVPLTNDQDQVIRLLLSRSDLKLGPQPQGMTNLLHMACSELAPLHMIEKLLKIGAEVNVFDAYFRTPLTIAIEKSCPHIVELLIKHGADPHIRAAADEWYHYRRVFARKEQDWTSLLRGPRAYHLNPLIMQTEDYQTPFETAIRVIGGMYADFTCHEDDTSNNSKVSEKHKEIFLRLLACRPLKPSKLMRAALKAPEALRLVLANGADPNGGEHSEKPPLMYVYKKAMSKDLETVAVAVELIAILLNGGADTDRKNEDGICFADVMRDAKKACASVTNEDAEFDENCTDLFFMQCWLVRHFSISLSLWHGWKVQVNENETRAEKMIEEFRNRKNKYVEERLEKDEYKSVIDEVMGVWEKKRARALALAERGGPRRSKRLRERSETVGEAQEKL